MAEMSSQTNCGPDALDVRIYQDFYEYDGQQHGCSTDGDQYGF